MSVNKAMDQALEYARQHVSECAAELVKMRETSILPGGHVRQLGELCRAFTSPGSHLTMAVSLAERASLEHCAGLLSESPHPNAGHGYFAVTIRDRVTSQSRNASSARTELVVAESAEAAAAKYERAPEDPEAANVFVLNAYLIGVFDRNGKLEVGASLPEPELQEEALFDSCSPS